MLRSRWMASNKNANANASNRVKRPEALSDGRSNIKLLAKLFIRKNENVTQEVALAKISGDGAKVVDATIVASRRGDRVCCTARVCLWQILLQKSFCIRDQNSNLLRRRLTP